MEDEGNESRKGNGEIGIRHSLWNRICGASGRLRTNGRARAEPALSFEHVLADLSALRECGNDRGEAGSELNPASMAPYLNSKR
jgi:hypothetical protein